MKKLLAILLALVMCMTLLPLAALAEGETKYVIAGKGSIFGTEWDPSNDNNRMEKNGDLYEKIYTNAPAGSYEFKVTDGSWTNCWGNNGNNYTFRLESDGTVKITFNPETKEIKVDTGVTYDYYVAGDSSLCGANWSVNDPDNGMTKNGDVYEKTYQNVPASTYAFKITSGSWNPSYPGENYTFTLSDACDVKITFNADTQQIQVIADKLVEAQKFVVETVTAVGGSTEGDGYLNGSAWKVDADDNVLTSNNGIYSITYTNVKSGDRELKLVLNGSWSNKSIGGDKIETGAKVDVGCGSNVSNLKFHVEKDGSTVKLELDLTEFDYENGTGARLTVTVTEPAAKPEDSTTTPDSKDDNAAPDNKDNTTVTPDNEDSNDNKKDDSAAPAPDSKTITIYAKVPADWTEAYLYTWQDGANGDPAWPGTRMTASKTNEGWYELTIPVDTQNVIVNAGNGKPQTVDLKLVSGSSYIVVGEAGEDGKYSAKMSSAPTGDTTELLAICGAMLLAATGVVTTVAGKKRFF